MLNLLRSDFYRLIRSKSFYICTLVAIALNSLNLFISYWAVKAMPEQKELYESLLPKSGSQYALGILADRDIKLIISIIISIFVVAEFSHGTMKNVVSKGFSKVKIYLSKLITMIAACYLALLIIMIVAGITTTIITGTFGDFTSDYTVDLIKTAGIELLINAAFASLMVFFAMLIRNLGGVIAINIIGVLTLIPLIFVALEYLVKHKVKFTEYDLFTNFAYFVQSFGSATGSEFLKATIVALVYLALSTALGIFAFIKSDIK